MKVEKWKMIEDAGRGWRRVVASPKPVRIIEKKAVEKVYLNFGKPDQIAIDKMTLKEVKEYIKEGHFKPGSMLPKIEAVIIYLESGGRKAIITDPEHIKDTIEGKTGTHVFP
ncbi:MAG: hypothetical protein ACK4JE_01485 [Endomicrobiia bacterium]